jgi:hypothetical protein
VDHPIYLRIISGGSFECESSYLKPFVIDTFFEQRRNAAGELGYSTIHKVAAL